MDHLRRSLVEMESHCSLLFGGEEDEGTLLCRRDLRRDSFGRSMGHRAFVGGGNLLGMVFLFEILVGKVGLDQYRHTVGKEVDCMPFSRGTEISKVQSIEIRIGKMSTG